MAPNNMISKRERRPPRRYAESSSEEETETRDVSRRRVSTKPTDSTGCTVQARQERNDDPIITAETNAEATEVKAEDEVSSVVTRDTNSTSAEGEAVLPQVSLSQSEDDHIHHLQTSGALNHVAGSQSILTQELDDTGAHEEEDDTVSSIISNKPNDFASALLTQESVSLIQDDSEDETSPTHESTEAPSVESPIVVKDAEEKEEEEEEENKTSLSQEEPTMQLSQLTCLMEAAEVMHTREQGKINDEENIPDDQLFDFDKDEEPGLVAMPQRPLALQQPESQPITAKSTKASRSIRPPTLPLTFNSANNKRKLPDASEAPPAPTMAPTGDTKVKTKALNPTKRRKLQKEAEQARSASMARRAADLAEQASTDPEVAKQLLLSMALVRTNPRSAPTTWPPYGSVIPEGFFWATYPPLESVLRSSMPQYYNLSVKRCQSRDQQAFNNSLVICLRMKAAAFGWSFHKNFDDKKLRDRIRCFFKTHIQNAKKRLKTMIRNPTKRANAKALVQHLELIQKHTPQEQESKEEEDDKRMAALALSGIAGTANQKTTKQQTV